MRIFVTFIFILFITSAIDAQGVDALNLLPKPQKMVVQKGKYFLLHRNRVEQSDIHVKMVDSIQEAAINQHQGYRLVVSLQGVEVEAVSQTGVYYALQTLNQLVVLDKNGRWKLPVCQITDWPAFRMRGFMHDVGRSFISVDELKKQIALLSKFKMNVFHWHLTENQGWRLQSKRYPQLNDSSSFERLPGKFYTIEDAHEISRWCRLHHVLLIPEIDMPGHSAAFVRAMGVDMQSKKGTEIIKNLMDEICTEVFPDEPYIHIGTDEVQFTNPDFVPQMVAFVRSKGKKVISWNPGWNYKPGEIDMTQLWSSRGKAQPGIPAIDSRLHYINHYDMYGDLVALYNSRIYNESQGSDAMAGSILGIWNDRLLENQTEIMNQNSFYPAVLALAERAWMGGGLEYFDKNGVLLPLDVKDVVFQEFADFERRMLWHKRNTLKAEPFPYVKQTNVRWRITDAFPNNGDLLLAFPPENELKHTYEWEGASFFSREAVGAGIYLRHVWGGLIPSFYPNPKENHTAYAYTWVYSPKNQPAGAVIEFQNYSRSEADLPPPAGKWDYKESRIWLNNSEIMPPVWLNTHTVKSNEISLKNENASARKPIPVQLKKGWNKVLVKLPIGRFSSPQVRLNKWMFTFVLVTPDGSEELANVKYSPDKIR